MKEEIEQQINQFIKEFIKEKKVTTADEIAAAVEKKFGVPKEEIKSKLIIFPGGREPLSDDAG